MNTGITSPSILGDGSIAQSTVEEGDGEIELLRGERETPFIPCIGVDGEREVHGGLRTRVSSTAATSSNTSLFTTVCGW